MTHFFSILSLNLLLNTTYDLAKIWWIIKKRTERSAYYSFVYFNGLESDERYLVATVIFK